MTLAPFMGLTLAGWARQGRGRHARRVVPFRRGAYRGPIATKSAGGEAEPSMAIKFAAARFTEQEALLFHSQGKPGKLEINATKPLTTQRDLSLAYSPGVAVPVL